MRRIERIYTDPNDSVRIRANPHDPSYPCSISGVCYGLFVAIVSLCSPAQAEEIWLHDNTRLHGLVHSISAAGQITVALPAGNEQTVPLEDVIAIRFLGRIPLLVQSGTQEFRLIDGGRLRGQILANQGDRLRLQTALAGEIDLDLAHVRGFVALPLTGFSGRKAEELVESDTGKGSPSLDLVLDRRGSVYPGVVRRLDRTQLDLDHDELLQVVPIKILYVAGVRLADAGRASLPRPTDAVQVRISGRDDSVIQGTLRKIHLGKWHLSPSWNPEMTLVLDVEEIARVQMLGGKVQYLSQLQPVRVSEHTILAPPQPYRLDQSAQGDALKIAGKRYPWGIGVHADSELTFALNGRFQEFRADIGLAAREDQRGSVVFSVLGDGKELYRSKVVTAAEGQPIPVTLSVQGVKELTLQVTNAGDLDLGDAANWGSARVLR